MYTNEQPEGQKVINNAASMPDGCFGDVEELMAR